MKKILAFIILVFFIFPIFGKSYERIISTSPSITEILFAINAGSDVKGVTPYCRFPDAAKNVAKIGTSLSLNYENILRQNPDLILLTKLSDSSTEAKLKKLKVPFEVVPHENLDDILKSVIFLGELTGKIKESKALFDSLKKDISSMKKQMSNKSVMIIIGSTLSSKKIKNLYLAGNKTFYNDIILNMGLKNVVTNSDAAYPLISGERIYKFNPDVIIHMLASGDHGDKLAGLKKAWANYDMIKAVQNKQVHYFTGDEFVIPGPRIIRAMIKVSKTLERVSDVKGE